MDLVPSMFMADSINEDEFLFSDSFLLSSFIPYQNQNHDACNPITDKNGSSNKRRSLSAREANKTNDDRESKKMKHRDIERQRRQEVSSLFKSLRSLLPFQYIQVSYVKDILFYSFNNY